MQLIQYVLFDAQMRYENEGAGGRGGGGVTLSNNYKHEICFRHKQKGNIYIPCASANACLPLFAEESRGCNVLDNADSTKRSAAQDVTDKKITTSQYIPSELFTARVCFAIMGGFCDQASLCSGMG